MLKLYPSLHPFGTLPVNRVGKEPIHETCLAQVTALVRRQSSSVNDRVIKIDHTVWNHTPG